MKKLLTILLLLTVILFSCSSTKTGCVPERKSKPIKFKGFLSPAQLQVKIIEVVMVGKGKADIKAIPMGRTDTVYLRYGWAAGSRNHNVKVGAWITVRYDADKCTPGTWTKADIKTNL